MSPYVFRKYVNEPYEGNEDILRLFRYIAGECDSKKERTRYRCGAGVSIKPDKAARQMIRLQKLYKKEAQSIYISIMRSMQSAI